MKTWLIETAGDVLEIKADRIAYNPDVSTIMFLKTTVKDGEASEILVGTVPADVVVSQKGG